MKIDLGFDVIKSISRAHYCFWLKEDPPVVHEVSTKTIVFLLFLTVVVLTLLGAGLSAVASAIYALYFIFALWLAGVLVFLRTGNLSEESVSILVEAYLVALLITIFLLSHNLFFPIDYFSQDPGLNRSVETERRISYAYTLPAGLYLLTQSLKMVKALRAKEMDEVAGNELKKADVSRRFDKVYAEVVLWSELHYVIVGYLIWLLVFANDGTVRRVGEILEKIDPL